MIVVCNGMLRSGSTLQLNIARLLIKASGRTLSHQVFIERPDRKAFSRLLDINAVYGDLLDVEQGVVRSLHSQEVVRAIR